MFKDSFKHYKAKWPIPDLTEVVNFDDKKFLETQDIQQLKWDKSEDKSHLLHGLHPIQTWHCFTLVKHPGLIVIRNPFTTQGQRYWMARCLRDFPRHPNVVNLNAQLFPSAVIEDWWRELQQCKDEHEARRLKKSMRWSTLGYHHDWDTKVYSETKRAEFPKDLGELCKFFANALGFEGFQAQAAIVNYYPIGTTLSGHTDHSEVNLNAPLFSFSFGQTAIFLIGGKTKEEKPIALYLQNGDLLVMSRDSRLCYHAVPRIMKTELENWNEPLERSATTSTESHENVQRRQSASPEYMNMLLFEQVADEAFWTPFRNYLKDSRININVRQVLHAGASTLS